MLESHSLHDVYRISETSWIKVAYDHTEAASERIERDHATSMFLGHPADLGFSDDGRTQMQVEHLGTMPNRLGTDMLERLVRYSALTGAGRDGVDVLAERARDDLVVRMSTGSGFETARDYLRGVLEASDLNALRGDVLAHTDPHRGNWVVDESGTARLIDWENASSADPHLDLGALLFSAVLEGNVPLVEAIVEDSSDQHALDAGYRLKAVRGLSHAWMLDLMAGRDAFGCLDDRIVRLNQARPSAGLI